MSFELREKLARVAGQVRSMRLWIGLALCWLVWAGVGAAMFAVGQNSSGRPPLGWLDVVAFALVSAVICAVVALTSARDERAIARRIEAKHPELGTLLLAAVEQASTPRKDLSYLQKAVICEAVAHGRLHNWNNTVGPWRLRMAKAAQFLSLLLFAVVCVGLATRAGASSGIGSSLFGGSPAVELKYEVAVDPGDCEIERGSPLVVIAEFNGTMPADAQLVIAGAAVGSQSQAMSRSLDDPKFVGRVPEVIEDISYRVEYAGRSSDAFHAKVFDYPALVRADARLEFPTYAGQEPKVVEDVRHVSAVEGTKLTLELRLNKPVADAQLVRADGDKTILKRDADDDKLFRTSWTLTESRRYKLQLRDAEGRANKMPEEFVITVTPNRPPKVTLERPARDLEVSPLEELQLKWKASDDYGIVRSGVSYSLGGSEPRDIELQPASQRPATATKPAKEKSLAHLIELESLEAKPDDLLSYYVWAEDIGPDGKPRRTESDMYFAEVRPFEQIFRQGEQPSEGEQRQQEQQEQQQGGGGAAQQAEELAQMQKEIINATWKLIRRESGAKPTAEFRKDTKLVKESQEAAIARATEMAQSIEDAQSREHLQSAQSHMEQSLEQLTTAEQKTDPSALRPSIAEQQAAYQDLLRLRAREFQVVRRNRQQRQQQRGQQGNRSNQRQRQLDQLELSADENRYETQNRARAPEENSAQQQNRETLNKLRDLARRQEDLSDRLRELQSELEKAQTPEERKELERELKRLRDQQQEILRDTDEMIAQNEQSNNAQQSQDTRQKMEDARSRVSQTSQALEQNQLSQAVTESARAGQQLQELRDDFRQQSANQFADDMTQMRRQARDLDARQQELSQQLAQQEQAPGRTLRPTGEAAETQGALNEQRENLGNLMERMKQTIEAAEEPEPLLARQLYETAREANQKRLEERLDVARKLMDAGVRREAGEAMKSADEGVGNLRQGVERAAESVLGNETESLRRAQSEIDQLAEELNREMDARRGTPSKQPGEEERQGSRPAGEGQQAEQSQRQGEQGDQREGAASQSPRQGEANEGNRERENGSQQGNRNGSNRDQDQQGNSPRAGGQQQGGNQPGSERENQEPAPSQQEGGQQGRAGRQQGEGQQQEEAEQDSNSQGLPAIPNQSARERSSLRGNNGNGGGNQDNSRSNQGGNDMQQLLDRAANREETRENGGGPNNPNGPITGRDFRGWSERLRDVEDMLDDADLRSEAARIRDRAAEARTDFKKHAAEPDWEKLRVSIAEPLNELSRRIENEIRRQESPDALVPIDRDPVPPEYTEQVRRYYERLGSGE